MRPSRVVFGEVRVEECLDPLLALNAGMPGMCTLHANSSREALAKMWAEEVGVLMEGGSLGLAGELRCFDSWEPTSTWLQ